MNKISQHKTSVSFLFCAFLTAMIFLIPIGCQKSSEQPVEPDIEITDEPLPVTNYIYKLDGVVVPYGSYDVLDSKYHTLTIGEKNEKEEGVLVFNAFTKKEDFYEFGKLYDLDLELEDEVDAHIAEYAETSGAIEEYEATGTVSQEFTNYVYNYMESKGLPVVSSRGPIMIYKNNCSNGGGLKILLSGGWFFMPPTYNDTVERYESLSFLVHNRVYTRTFYRTRIFTHWTSFNMDICFEGPLAGLANRASSWRAY